MNSYSMPGTVPGTEDVAMSQRMIQVFLFREFKFSWGLGREVKEGIISKVTG